MAVQDIRLLPFVMEQYTIGFRDAYKRSLTKVAKVGLRTVVQGTPVDTGRAVNNWVVTLNRPHSSYINSGAYGSAANVQSRGNAVIDSVNTVKPQSIYIVNNAPYIERLNDGWSRKKPAGFIQKALQAMQTESKNAKFLKRGRG